MKLSDAMTSKRCERLLWITPAALHLFVAVAVFIAARTGGYPSAFDENTIGAFAPDAQLYFAQARYLTNELHQRAFASWLTTEAPIHVKVYSLSYAVLSPFFGFTDLAIEPINLACYTLIVVLVYKLGAHLFNRIAGLGAAAAVALWPSFIVHTTQPLKDPLFITLLLSLVLSLAILIDGSMHVSKFMKCSCAAIVSVLLMIVIRPNMMVLSLIVFLIGSVFILVNRLGGARVRSVILLTTAIAMLVAAALFVLVRGSSSTSNVSTGCSVVLDNICTTRANEIKFSPGLKSNIDDDVKFTSAAEVLRYSPRALEIGLFAPFPNMWFEPGAYVGRAGRLVAGGEMICIYLIYPLAAYGVWMKRKRISIWFLLLVFLGSVILFGLVVVNVGTLYRMRYGFEMIPIILGAGGLSGGRARSVRNVIRRPW